MVNKTAWYLDKELIRTYRQKVREYDKKLGQRFDNERNQGECFTEFKERVEKELGIRYHSWERIPGEPEHEFKKRLTGKTL